MSEGVNDSLNSSVDELDPLIGFVIAGRYRIERSLSRGAMGKIYVAEQMPLGRKVALKILDEQSRNSTDDTHTFESRFLREAATCARLNHPNTVRVFDYGRFLRAGASTWFMAMELIVGETLREHLKREGSIEASRALRIVREVARSLREAHRLGVIHRDLKPSNIMLLQGEEGESVKVLDFGIAKILSDHDGGDLTAADRVIGTPRYMAPEMIRHRPVDARTDLYCLGVVLYELLAGEPPFNGDVVQIAMAHVNEAPKPILEFRNIKVPPQAEAIAMRCMAKKPDDRFRDASAFIAACDAAIDELALQSGGCERPVSDRPYTALLTASVTPASISTNASWNRLREQTRSSVSDAFELSRVSDSSQSQPFLEPVSAEESAPKSHKKLVWLVAAAVLACVLVVSVILSSSTPKPVVEQPPAPIQQPVAPVVAVPQPTPAPILEPKPEERPVIIEDFQIVQFVQLTSEPSEALVKQGDLVLGKTPFSIEKQSDAVVLTLELENYAPVEIEIRENSPEQMHTVLKRRFITKKTDKNTEKLDKSSSTGNSASSEIRIKR